MKNAFHGLIIILDKAEERVSMKIGQWKLRQREWVKEKKDIQNSRDRFK